MKTIGLIGGMSWESSSEYYRIINEEVKNRLGGLHSARCILYNVDFQEIADYQIEGNWGAAARRLGDAAKSLERAGADFIVLCTNTMHIVAREMMEGIDIPLLHIIDVTAKEVLSRGIKTVGLLGTRYTMEQDFYRSRLESHGLRVLVPGEKDREMVDSIIFDELCLGQINEESRIHYIRVIEDLAKDGAKGIILGCTEIGLLVKSGDSPMPLFDTTLLHAVGAVDFALVSDQE
ncbi:MAG: aspartate/glutamate racemase family protein [Clostridia bacterium]|nr:aspartate/glutamate racemase family protein [Clostridia bacterium]